MNIRFIKILYFPSSTQTSYVLVSFTQYLKINHKRSLKYKTFNTIDSRILKSDYQ
jgi:hypothetical protein